MPDTTALADRFAIRELIDRYCYSVNERDWPVMESCYTEDAVWDVGKPFNFRMEGRKSIIAAASTKIAEEEYVIQTPHATMIWLDGDKARTHTTIEELVRSKGGTAGIQILATYADQLVKLAGEWRFKVRTYRVTNIEFKAPPGECHREWPSR
jgi:ketosteroid isomerase-like protein